MPHLVQITGDYKFAFFYVFEISFCQIKNYFDILLSVIATCTSLYKII